MTLVIRRSITIWKRRRKRSTKPWSFQRRGGAPKPNNQTNVHGSVNSKVGTSSTTGQIYAQNVFQFGNVTLHNNGRTKRLLRFLRYFFALQGCAVCVSRNAATEDTGDNRHRQPDTGTESSDGSKPAAGLQGSADSGSRRSAPEDTGEPRQPESGEDRDTYDPAKEMTEGQLKAIPIDITLKKAIGICKNQRVTVLVGNRGEGEHFIIKEFCKEQHYTMYHIRDINELAEKHQNLPIDGKVAVVIWNISDFIKDKNELAKVLESIVSNATASEINRKYIFICQPGSLKFLQKKMKVDKIFDEKNIVKLTELNGHPDHWRDRLKLLQDVNLNEKTRKKVAKMEPQIGSFPSLCVEYNRKGVEHFTKPKKCAKEQFKNILSSNGNATAAVFVLLAACKGSYRHFELVKGNLPVEHELATDISKNLSKKDILQTLECWEGSILKCENNVWKFANEVWHQVCILHLQNEYYALFILLNPYHEADTMPPKSSSKPWLIPILSSLALTVILGISFALSMLKRTLTAE